MRVDEKMSGLNAAATLRRDEQALDQVEAQLAAEWDRLEATEVEVRARLELARLAAAKLQTGTNEPAFHELRRRLEEARLDRPDVGVEREKALKARQEAVAARQRAVDAERRVLQAHIGELSKLGSRLGTDEAALAKFEAQSKEAARPKPQPQPKPVAATAPASPAQGEASAEATGDGRAEPRRGQARVRMQAAVDLQSDTNFFTGFSTNLSEGGLFVATVNALPIGTEVELDFTLDGERIRIGGIVRWTREINDRTPEIFPGMGIQFRGLDEATSLRISRFVESREPMFFPD